MDHLFCIRVFTRVVEHGTFARAAEDLELSRATASTAVARLETRLGVRLLHRTTRRLSLTDEGRAYYHSCVRLLDELAEAEEALSGARLAPRGRLRVSVPNAFVHSRFFTELPDFLARYPQLAVELVITDRAVNLVEEGIDCAVRAVPLDDDSTLVARAVAPVRRVTCAAPAYLAARGRPSMIDELEQHDCIRFISPSTGRVTEWTFEADGARRRFVPHGRLGVTSLEGAVAAAAVGIGIAQVSDVLAQRHLRAGTLELVLARYASVGPSVCVVYPSNRFLSAKVRAFGDFVAALRLADTWSTPGSALLP